VTECTYAWQSLTNALGLQLICLWNEESDGWGM